MLSSEMWRRVDLVRTYVSEERIASIIRVARISKLETTLALTNKFNHITKKHKLYEKGEY
jgi:hypothetical protein